LICHRNNSTKTESAEAQPTSAPRQQSLWPGVVCKLSWALFVCASTYILCLLSYSVHMLSESHGYVALVWRKKLKRNEMKTKIWINKATYNRKDSAKFRETGIEILHPESLSRVRLSPPRNPSERRADVWASRKRICKAIVRVCCEWPSTLGQSAAAWVFTVLCCVFNEKRFRTTATLGTDITMAVGSNPLIPCDKYKCKLHTSWSVANNKPTVSTAVIYRLYRLEAKRSRPRRTSGSIYWNRQMSDALGKQLCSDTKAVR